MGIGLDLLLDEFRHIEVSMSEVYSIFQKMFPEDADFWWTLSQEELNHASLISSIKQTFVPLGKYPAFINEVTFEAAFNEEQQLKDLIERLKTEDISREEAFQIAFDFENSAMENHYQQFMSSKDINKIDEIFQKLNHYDKDHADRISKYAIDSGIKVNIPL